MPANILISAGEASGDRYAGALATHLRELWPEVQFFGCTGPEMRKAGVETVVDASSLAVVGLLEVVHEIPRIWREFQKLVDASRKAQPQLAILTDSPDFHLRLARKLKQQGIPVVYLVAPQVWAWREGRVKTMRRRIDLLLCIFPFELEFFQRHRVPAEYIGHPLTRLVRVTSSRDEFFRKHRLPADRPLIVVLPGSRRGEAARHMPGLIDAAKRLYRQRAVSFVLPASATTGAEFFRERIADAPIQIMEGETWNAIGHADVALAASGTVTVEAALLGTPMVTFYKVTWPSWIAGKLLVRVPFFCMVNLVAGRRVVPELMQGEMTGERLAAETLKLLDDDQLREQMKRDLRDVRMRLSGGEDPIERAARLILSLKNERE